MRNITMVEFEERVKTGAWVIIPVGTLEEHGQHLPLGTDTIQAEYIARAVARAIDGLVAPTLDYGLCRMTRNFPGTVYLSYETVERAAYEVMRRFSDKGANRLLLLSGHAGGAHMVALRQAAQRLVEEREELKILVLCPYDIPIPFLEDRNQPQADGHAGALETSTILAIDETLVKGEFPPPSHPSFPPFQVLAHPEVCFPSGVLGDPTNASQELGERILSHFTSEIVKLLVSHQSSVSSLQRKQNNK
mgnify:FL=1